MPITNDDLRAAQNGRILDFAKSDPECWKRGLDANTDPYGRRVYTYAAAWAALMEEEIAKGRSVSEVADDTSRRADTDGISGYMHAAAVHVLSQTWVHGMDLRRWHNRECGSDRMDGTVNPAILTVE